MKISIESIDQSLINNLKEGDVLRFVFKTKEVLRKDHYDDNTCFAITVLGITSFLIAFSESYPNSKGVLRFDKWQSKEDALYEVLNFAKNRGLHFEIFSHLEIVSK